MWILKGPYSTQCSEGTEGLSGALESAWWELRDPSPQDMLQLGPPAWWWRICCVGKLITLHSENRFWKALTACHFKMSWRKKKPSSQLSSVWAERWPIPQPYRKQACSVWISGSPWRTRCHWIPTNSSVPKEGPFCGAIPVQRARGEALASNLPVRPSRVSRILRMAPQAPQPHVSQPLI